ncbi:MAG: TonB-dependent receptor [Candidatus Aminicenantales bacterium]
MKLKALLLSIFFVGLAMNALAVEIKGKVVSPDGKPVAAAVIREAAGAGKAVSDAEGNFVLATASSGQIRLTVEHPNFFEEEVIVSTMDAAKPLTVRLTALIRQKAEVMVTALRYPEPSTRVPAAQTVVSAELIQEQLASNITAALTGIPGLAPLGSGGFSLVPSIRGLARNRILLLIDGSRIVSDRRTGPSASFLNPEDLARIEILRSPSSIFYGSDAVGGVVQMFTKEPPAEDEFAGRLHAGYGTINREKSYGLALSGRKGAWGFYLSGQGLDAEEYKSPLGLVLQSQFAQAGLLAKISCRTGARDIDLSFLGARGVNIGKPNRTSATKPTWYPRENQNLVQLHWQEKNLASGEFSFHIYANPNFLETRTKTITAGTVSKDSFSRTESTELGAQILFSRTMSRSLRLTGGLDYFGRSGASAILREDSFDAQGALTKSYSETSYDRGRRSDIGLFLSGDFFDLQKLDLVGGLRWDSIVQSANPGGGETKRESRRNALTGFLAASFRLAPLLTVFANASTAYRTPGLSELFYTGITGRGMIIAQPGLTPERSLNFDAGVKWVSNRLYTAAYGFVYTIDGLIDRYLVAPQTYTYGNLDKARLRGLEMENEFYPSADWKIFGTLTVLDGTSVISGLPVNDIPPLRLTLGTRVWVGKFSAEISGLFQGRKNDPGPAEIAMGACRVFSFKANYFWSSLNIYLAAGNLFNSTYLSRPDPEAVEEPGRSLVFGLSYSF